MSYDNPLKTIPEKITASVLTERLMERIIDGRISDPVHALKPLTGIQARVEVLEEIARRWCGEYEIEKRGEKYLEAFLHRSFHWSSRHDTHEQSMELNLLDGLIGIIEDVHTSCGRYDEEATKNDLVKLWVYLSFLMPRLGVPRETLYQQCEKWLDAAEATERDRKVRAHVDNKD